MECFKGLPEEQVGWPVVFNEEIFAMFCLKMSQIDTEKDKTPKIFPFSKSLCIFLELLQKVFFMHFSTDFVNWNVKKGQQGKNVLSNMLRKKMNEVIREKTVRN